MKRGDRVLVSETPGRWWIAGERSDLLALAPDDLDAMVYQATSVHAHASCMPRWAEDVRPAPGAPCPVCRAWRDGPECDRCGNDTLPL